MFYCVFRVLWEKIRKAVVANLLPNLQKICLIYWQLLNGRLQGNKQRRLLIILTLTKRKTAVTEF